MPSESEFIGSMVSIDCGELGAYQGRVEKIDPVMNTLTITHAFHNGLRCDLPQVNLSSTAIIDIKIIHASHEAKEIITRKATPSKMTKEIDDVTKPVCTSPVKIIKATSKAQLGFNSGSAAQCSGVNSLDLAYGKSNCRRRLSPPESPSKLYNLGAETVGPRPRASHSVHNMPDLVEQGNGCGEENGGKSKNGSNHLTDHHGRKVTAAKKMEWGGGRKGANAKNSECFSAPADSFMQEFDFESNLALFNKKAVFEEIENGFPEVSLESAREQKYRHDENILQPGGNTQAPLVMKQQIKVPESKCQLYYTDTGLVVPSISPELKDKVCETASQHGLTHARQLEAYGRAASEMVIHLIGGSYRIHPKNGHQVPSVVVLSGPHEHGAMGVCCARILSSHGVQVTLLLPDSSNLPPTLMQEVELFNLTGSKLVHNVTGLPDTIDLIVTAVDSYRSPLNMNHPWFQSITSWLKKSDIRAQVLALDPPPHSPSIPAKWSLCRVLPLNHVSSTCGSLYLCDLCIPTTIFQKCGITYISPFGSKFVIPLHVKE